MKEYIDDDGIFSSVGAPTKGISDAVVGTYGDDDTPRPHYETAPDGWIKVGIFACYYCGCGSGSGVLIEESEIVL